MTKVQFAGARPDDCETLWATPLGGNLHRLGNSPFFAYGVSWQDIIEARETTDEAGCPRFVRRIAKSDNRTVRLIFNGSLLQNAAAQKVLATVTRMGCTYEGMKSRLVSINVPPAADLGLVTSYLSTQAGLQWEYADPTYEELQRKIV